MITRLTLDNFKCFAHESLPLRRLTVLTGVNGIGKSTVIQALLLLRQSAEQGLIQHGLLLNGSLTSLGTASDVLYRDAEVERIGIRVDVDGLSSPWWFRYDNQFDDVLPLHASPSSNAGTLFEQEFHYLSAERIGP